MARIGSAGFPDDVVRAVDHVVPGASVPMVVAREIKDSRAFNVDGYVKVVTELIEEVTGVSGVVAASAVVGASHIRPGADALVRPSFPKAICVEADRDDGRRLSRGAP